MLFSDLVKSYQLKKKLTLRKLSEKSNLDVGQLSRILSDLIPPFQDPEKLERLAQALEIEKNSKDYERLFDYANLDAGKLPEYIKNNEDVKNSLPAFFRTIDKRPNYDL